MSQFGVCKIKLFKIGIKVSTEKLTILSQRTFEIALLSRF